MTLPAVVLGASIATPLVLLADNGGTTITLPPALPAAGAIVLIGTALGLLWRFVGRPIYRATKYVRERLEENSALVEQVRELVQYVGLFGGDVEARLDRLEKANGLGYYRREQDRPVHVVPPALLERLRTQQAIRDLGEDNGPASWS